MMERPGKVFFCNSGAEANDGLIKLARKRAWEKYGTGTIKNVVITCKGDRVILKEDVAKALAGDEPESGWRPENIQPLFAKMTCDGLGGTLLAKTTPDGIVFMATGLRQQSA
jgi:hypothetical protein